MKLFIGIFVVICLELITIDTNEIENSSPINPVAFAFDLYDETLKSMSNENDNIIISPLSIQLCLILGFMGAQGKTAEELSSGLYLGTLDKGEVGYYFKNFLKPSDENSSITIVNKIYLQNGVEIRKYFGEVFKSNIKNLDLSKSSQAAKLINDWIKNETHNKIGNLIEKDDLTGDLVALMVNAIDFRGKWQKPFTVDTRNATFWLDDQNSIEVPTMYAKKHFKYAQLVNLNAFAVEIPYNNSDISMLVIVPNDKTGLKQLERNLKSINLSDIERQMELKEFVLGLPKFKSEFSINLNNILKNMNMKTMFSDNADFSLLANSQIKVNKVYHKAMIEVHEYGTEAAARTSQDTVRRIMKFVRVDKQFFYCIKGKNVIYFMGRVVNVL